MALPPEASAAALELYEALEPTFTDGDEGREWVTLKMCIALVAGNVDRLHIYVSDQPDGTPGWGIIFDPDTCPAEALPYLAQFGGTVLRPDMDEAAIRAAIKHPQSFRRGTLPYAIEVLKRRLTGTKTVIVTERYTSNPWRVLIETLDAETPEPEKTKAEFLEEAKPIGILAFFNERALWTWGEFESETVLYPTWAAAEAAFSTYADAEAHEP